MRVIVVYASKYGFTKGIAESISDKLQELGVQAEEEAAGRVSNFRNYDAFVIGSAIYNFHWLKEAREFVARNGAVLAERPVWLFSSGPLGFKTKDSKGRELTEVAVPEEIAGFKTMIRPRDHRVFFGGLDSRKLDFGDRVIRRLPTARDALPDGDFRDWKQVETWSGTIARELEVLTPSGVLTLIPRIPDTYDVDLHPMDLQGPLRNRETWP